MVKRAAMSNTKRKFLGSFWKGSKYIDDEFKEDLESILDKYSRLGYRDSRILVILFHGMMTIQ